MKPRPLSTPKANADVFPLSRNYAHKRHAREAVKAKEKRSYKHLIKSVNAKFMAELIPQKGESIHVVTFGDFIFCDCLPFICQALREPVDRMTITTLSASPSNVATIHKLLMDGVVKALDLWVSKYFLSTDKANTPKLIESTLEPLDCVRVNYARIHTKLILLETESRSIVYEGSANLRSSNTVEQVTIYDDRELLEFHRSWISSLKAR